MTMPVCEDFSLSKWRSDKQAKSEFELIVITWIFVLISTDKLSFKEFDKEIKKNEAEYLLNVYFVASLK